MKKSTFSYVLTILGVVLLGVGLYLIKTMADPKGFLLALPYVCVGVGSGVFGQGMGNIISRKAMKKHPDLEGQLEIEKNDERNLAIEAHSKAKAYDIMVPVMGALLLAFALMGVDRVVILLLVFAYLFIIGYGCYYRFKYNKEM